MKKRWTGILVMLCMLGLSACGGNTVTMTTTTTGKTPETLVKSMPVEQGPEVTAIDLETEEEEYTLADGKTLGLSYYYELPVITLSKGYQLAEADINRDAEDLKSLFLTIDPDGNPVEDSRQTMLEWAEEQYKERLEYDPDAFKEYAFPCYAMDRRVAPARSSDGLLSMVYEDYYYLGGAHGGTIRRGHNYDLYTGAVLLLDDIAIDLETFTNFLNEKVLELSLTPDYYVEGYHMFYEDYEKYIPEVVEEGHWYFTYEGLTLIADQYQLAPYAAGIIEFTIPYADLAGYVQDQYLLQ